MIEIDKKQQNSESTAASTSSLLATVAATNDMSASGPGKSVAAVISDTTTMQERMQELIKQISDEARRLAATRAELQKTKKIHSETLSEKPSSSKKGSSADAADAETASEALHRGQQKLTVPEHLMPELCKYVAVASGAWTITNDFYGVM